MLLGARQFFAARKAAPLPYDAEVEYLRNTGLTQYIDTGVLGGEGLRVVADITPRQIANDKWAIGSYDANARLYVAYQYAAGASGGYWGGGYGGYFSGSTVLTADKKISLDVEYTPDYQILKIDGVETKRFAKSGFTGTVSHTLYLFGLHYNNGNTGPFLCDIGPVQIYTGSVLVRDYIPVRVGTVGCMYDKVSGQLFRNQGTGAFSYGADVTPQGYIKDGLIALWDAIDNAGNGVHNNTATVWKDLVGTNHLNCSSYLTWGSNCAQITGDTCFGNDIYDMTGCSMEFVWQDSQQGATSNYVSVGAGAGIASPWYAHVGCGSAGTTTASLGVGFSNGNNPATNKQNVRSYSFVRSSIIADRRYWIDGVRYESLYNYPGSQLSQITGVHMMANVGTMKTYCVRLYNRALTDAEIAANYAIDKARFNLP